MTARRRPETRRSSAHKRGRHSFCQRNGPALPELLACEGAEPEQGVAAANHTADQQGEPELNLDPEPLPLELGPAQQSTPEAPPTRLPRPAPQQQKKLAPPPRGRKPDRVPLKKPWENAKPRGRSKSRERANHRPRPAPAAAATPTDRLNASLGGNDTFDFDCEEAVHLTPFRAGGRPAGVGPGGDTPTGGVTTPSGGVATPSGGMATPSDSESSSSQDEGDSLYLPYRERRGNAGGGARAETPPRRARSKRRSALQAKRAQGAARGQDDACPKPAAPSGESADRVCVIRVQAWATLQLSLAHSLA